MSIEDLRAEKKAVERQIEHLLHNYTQHTGLKISDVLVAVKSTRTSDGEPKALSIHVEIISEI